jgi:DNA-directed RNA polymerase subunit beta
MNIGQVLELHLGAACKNLGIKIATPVFDGATETDIKDLLVSAGLDSDGKTTLYDDAAANPLKTASPSAICNYLKLAHLVDDKIHARSTGPYSLVTQQPLAARRSSAVSASARWKSGHWSVRRGLHPAEILTVKSDDVCRPREDLRSDRQGRQRTAGGCSGVV